MSYDPLVPLEQDFASSVSSKARGGELGCWVDVEKTRMISVGVQRGLGIAGTKKWWGIGKSMRLRYCSLADPMRHCQMSLSGLSRMYLTGQYETE